MCRGFIGIRGRLGDQSVCWDGARLTVCVDRAVVWGERVKEFLRKKGE